MRTPVRLAVALATAFALAAPHAHATDGYFAHGYGTKAIGMGGAAVAVALEPYGGAINPGAMVFLGNEWSVGLSWFSPDRSAERSGSGPANIDGSADSGSTNFFIPEFGINWKYRPDLAFGVTVYGNGGMNTDYPGDQIPAQSACAQFNPTPGPYNLLCGNGRLGVDLTQLMVAPYVSWQFVPNHAVGLAPVFAYQRFAAEGLQAFDNPLLSTQPGSVTNRGYDSAYGWGVRVGYMGQFAPWFSAGLAYSTKMSMSDFDRYAGLYAQSGAFDIPSNFTVGAAFRPTPQWLIAIDFERIFYDDAPSVSNRSALIGACAMMGVRDNCLGGSDGAGFGWQNVDVWKLGVQYTLDQHWTFRAGYNHSDNPIEPQDVTFNILAPGVVQNHYTAGFTYAFDKLSELSGSLWYASQNSVSGQSLLVGFGAPPTTTETIKMKEYSVGVAYLRRF